MTLFCNPDSTTSIVIIGFNCQKSLFIVAKRWVSVVTELDGVSPGKQRRPRRCTDRLNVVVAQHDTRPRHGVEVRRHDVTRAKKAHIIPALRRKHIYARYG